MRLEHRAVPKMLSVTRILEPSPAASVSPYVLLNNFIFKMINVGIPIHLSVRKIPSRQIKIPCI